MDKKNLNPEWVSWIQRKVNPSPYFELQKMIVKDIGWGTSLLEIDLEKRHLQPFGIVHGGVFASLLDAAGFWAVYSQAPANMGMTTVDLNINYLAGAVSGKLIGIGQCVKLGKTIGVGQSQIKNESGNLLAIGKVTLMILKHNDLSHDNTTPISKFLSCERLK